MSSRSLPTHLYIIHLHLNHVRVDQVVRRCIQGIYYIDEPDTGNLTEESL